MLNFVWNNWKSVVMIVSVCVMWQLLGRVRVAEARAKSANARLKEYEAWFMPQIKEQEDKYSIAPVRAK